MVLADSTLEVLAGSRPVLWSVEALEGVPEEVADRARWWEQHIVEVLTGRRPESPPGQPIRPEFDPAVRSLRQRELTKLEELRAAGHDLALITLQRQRSRYEAKGLLGLV
ncbi:integrase, partial [Mycolicibacterium wolinskyi]